MRLKLSRKKILLGIGAVMLIGVAMYAISFSNRIFPHTLIGTVPVGGMTREEAVERLASTMALFSQEGIRLQINDSQGTISPDDIGVTIDADSAVQAAFARGHTGSFLTKAWDGLASMVSTRHVEVPVEVDTVELAFQIDQVAAVHESARQDVRLQVTGTTVTLLTDTKPGKVIDREPVTARIMHALATLDRTPIPLTFKDDAPIADPALAASAATAARAMMSRPLTLQYQDSYFTISRARIGTWIVSTYDGAQLVASISRPMVAQYLTTVAKALNVDSQPPQVTTVDGRITNVIAPKVGQAVQESILADSIIAALVARTDADKAGDTITIPMKTTTLSLSGVDLGAGITELIGKSVTTFAGSPKNRISNIKNGVKAISGTIIQPGQEFSTLGTLGSVDGENGYVPELVIKGNRTTPDFGGGLCQVSTTLFRSVLNTGLPVTARRNHSYRVSYYEKDGNGVFIGPGLDATIYEPDLDFKFRNDMTTPVLIIGSVIGDKVIFELYGTKDGRSSAIDGPKLLSETPSGDPIYAETDTLPKGMKKQVETPHPGGTAVAVYTVTYRDGHKATQTFNSRYRPWPAQYLIGTNPNCSTAAQCAAMAPVVSVTPTPFPMY